MLDVQTSFFWLTSLSLERREEIVEFYNNLPITQQMMISDMISDALDEHDWNNNEE